MGFIKNISNWSTLKLLVFFVAIVCVIMLSAYFLYFGVHLHRSFGNVEDWGSFGSYMGSITGLLAFAGVLYTVMEAKKETKEAKNESIKREERDLFFIMLSMYQRQADIITKDKSFSEFTKDGGINSIIYIIYETIVNDDDFKLSDDPDILLIQKAVATSFGINLDNLLNSKDEIAQNLKAEIKIRFEKNNFEIPEYMLTNDLNKEMQNYFHKVIFPKISNQNIDKYIFNTIRGIADMIFIKNEDTLGQYFRTIYYILETISTNIEKERYSKIFRSQLSKSELTLLLYNLVSSQSSTETIKFYKENDIFNNLNVDDVFMNRLFKNRYKGNEFINMLYKGYALLGKK